MPFRYSAADLGAFGHMFQSLVLAASHAALLRSSSFLRRVISSLARVAEHAGSTMRQRPSTDATIRVAFMLSGRPQCACQQLLWKNSVLSRNLCQQQAT